MSQRYGIWTSVSGGLMGPRSAWVKGADGVALVFATQGEAEARAAELAQRSCLCGGYSPSGRPIARQTFVVRQYGEAG